MWKFGDGTTSTEQNPSHTYEKNGSYTVSLTVTGPGGSDTKTMEEFVQANAAPIKVNIRLTKRLILRSWYTVFADVTVTQNNPAGATLAGVTVKGNWTGCDGGTVSATTNENGVANFRIDWIPQRTTVTFTIDKVIIDGKEYIFTGKTSEFIGM